MKKFIIPALMLLAFAACTKKNNVTPTKPVVIAPIYDTIPDGAAFSIYLVKDSTTYDFTAFDFNHKAHLGSYEAEGDWGYFFGPDPVTLYSISIDNQDLEDNFVPYSRGVSFRLHVNCNEKIPIYMKLHYYHNMPATIHIWCKDNYLKDSVDMIHGAHVNLSIDHTIPASYSDDRFQVVLWSDKKN